TPPELWDLVQGRWLGLVATYRCSVLFRGRRARSRLDTAEIARGARGFGTTTRSPTPSALGALPSTSANCHSPRRAIPGRRGRCLIVARTEAVVKPGSSLIASRYQRAGRSEGIVARCSAAIGGGTRCTSVWSGTSKRQSRLGEGVGRARGPDRVNGFR